MIAALDEHHGPDWPGEVTRTGELVREFLTRRNTPPGIATAALAVLLADIIVVESAKAATMDGARFRADRLADRCCAFITASANSRRSMEIARAAWRDFDRMRPRRPT
jgi:hypothetical protein